MEKRGNNYKHGMRDTGFYKTWNEINYRCNDPKNIWYGQKKVKVFWSSFLEFKDDMLISYLAHEQIHGRKNTTIDRIDNTKGYSKKNCRWATQKEQQRNRTNNRLLTFNGETKCLMEWSEKLGMKRQTIETRLRAGWSIKKAFTTPLMFNKYAFRD